MKIHRLDLKAVGPFTDATLDLSPGAHGLHLIYGANEAGKSSALRAITYLLYGFGHNVRDDFVHNQKELRVGATILHSDGSGLSLVRRRGRVNTLRADDDQTPLPDDVLERFLPGVDRESFQALFGINHEDLRKGGEEIRKGSGRFGDLLFAAAAGLHDLRKVQTALTARVDDLYKPRGQNQRINQLLSGLQHTREEIKRSQLSSDDWTSRDQAMKDAQRDSEALKNKAALLHRRQYQLERVRLAKPLIARLRMLREQLETQADAPRLPETFGDRVRQAQAQHDQAVRIIAHSEGELTKLRIASQSVAVPLGFLEAAEAIGRLRENYGKYAKAQTDRPKIETRKLDHEYEAKNILRDLGRPRDLTDVEALRISDLDRAAIQQTGQEQARLIAQLDEARGHAQRLQRQLQKLDGELEESPPAPDLTPLRSAVRSALKGADLDAELIASRQKLRTVERALARALQNLPHWTEALDRLEALTIPLDETIEAHQREWKEHEDAHASLKKQWEKADETRNDLLKRMQPLEKAFEVPSKSDLREARALRDQGWRLVRSSWLESRPVDAAPFLSQFAPDLDLASAFEVAVRACDDLVDRLHREADRVAQREQLQLQLETAQLDLQERHAALLEANNLRDAHAKRWTTILQNAGLPALNPAELKPWLRRRDDVIRLAAERHSLTQETQRLQERIDSHRDAIAEALTSLQQQPPPADAPLDTWVQAAETLVDAIQSQAKRLDKALSSRAEKQAELHETAQRIAEAEAQLALWGQSWQERMRKTSLPADTTPEQATLYLDRLTKMFAHLKDAHEEDKRIRGIDRDASEFKQELNRLVEQLDPDLAQRDVTEQVRALQERLVEAQSQNQRRISLKTQLASQHEQCQAARKEREAVTDQLRSLCLEAGCDDPKLLLEIDRRATERRRLEDDLQTCQSQVLTHANSVPIETFVIEVDAIEADSLTAELDQLHQDLEANDHAQTSVNQVIGELRNELARMDGSAQAAELAEGYQGALSRLRDEVAEYVRLRLAGVVLRQGIERYREKHQGPVLSRAGALFATLTEGSFQDLRIDDEEGSASLKGVRADGRLVDARGMSDGSQDQLYLALRLASLEAWMKTHEPVPFIVDDILLNFDNARALAALRALEELSTSTQVIFFTHHAHLVELAEANLSPRSLFVQRLPNREPLAAPSRDAG